MKWVFLVSWAQRQYHLYVVGVQTACPPGVDQWQTEQGILPVNIYMYTNINSLNAGKLLAEFFCISKIKNSINSFWNTGIIRVSNSLDTNQAQRYNDVRMVLSTQAAVVLWINHPPCQPGVMGFNLEVQQYVQ